MNIKKMVLLVVVLLLFGLLAARDRLLRPALESALAQELEAEVQLEAVRTHLWRSTIQLSNIRIRNLPELPGDGELVLNEVRVKYRLWSLWKQTVDLPAVLLDIERIIWTAPTGGRSGLEGLFPAASAAPGGALPATPGADGAPSVDGVAGEGPAVPAPPATARPERPARQVLIEELTLRLGELEVHQPAEGDRPATARKYRLNLESQFSDVSDASDVLEALGADLLLALAPQLISEQLGRLRGARKPAAAAPPQEEPSVQETLESLDLEELGRELDEQTKDLQRELRNQFRSLRGRE